MITNDNSYSVYCHTNMTNGKKYFGKAKNIKKRWGKNGRVCIHRYKKFV